eukprot:CAMPEP_0180795838 /NCGR_PEP_ID=MMETSP1038_2-20121128/56438_1 /TAXON_ID=632150 /ORGANISM="Azadinium spinosum, Strain 3D9" /LENGTH=60 /DNA_ID=CAMNT_0022834835 /DNA_START=24 /DNA_END=204 /DNA_ORIENTATION=+
MADESAAGRSNESDDAVVVLRLSHIKAQSSAFTTFQGPTEAAERDGDEDLMLLRRSFRYD